MFEPFCKFAALWLRDVTRCVKSKQIRNGESHRDASREAAGPYDTVLLMLYKWRERLILNLVNKKNVKTKNSKNTGDQSEM